MNIITISGRLTADPEIRYTPSGTAVLEAQIAVNDGFGDKQKSYFFPIVAWKHTAEYIANNAGKGSLIVLSGRLTQDQWVDNQTQQNRSKIKITANEVCYIEKRN